MRTLRKILWIACLAALLTVATASAAPTQAESAAERHSVRFWVLSVFDSLVARILPSDARDDGDSQTTDQSVENEDPPPSDEYGGVMDPGG